jgi:hypothetical protein
LLGLPRALIFRALHMMEPDSPELQLLVSQHKMMLL